VKKLSEADPVDRIRCRLYVLGHEHTYMTPAKWKPRLRWRETVCAILLVVVSLNGAETEQAPENLRPNPDRLKRGLFRYRSMDHGNEIGQGEIAIRMLPNSGNFEISMEYVFSGGPADFQSQRWRSVAKANFDPVLASLSYVRAGKEMPAFGLNYFPGRVMGLLAPSNGAAKGKRLPINGPIPPEIVDQRLDWAAVLSSNMEVGREFRFDVYDPGTGVSWVLLNIGPIETVGTPDGRFEAYGITYLVKEAGGTELYKVYASRDSPRLLFREEFPNGSYDELVQVVGDRS
jgi:hypothetical protein